MNSITDYRNETTTSKVLQALFIELIFEAKSHITAVLTQNDDEELHQYRVALRKMHSILHEFSDCMDRDIFGLLKLELKAMISPTNELRDMDVFLENMDAYRAMLQPKYKKNITQVENRLKKAREKSFEGVKQFVKSPEYMAILSVVNDLTKEDKFYNSCSLNPIDKVLAGRIAKRYKAIRNEAKKLTKHDDPKHFHKLRISVKKLRYLVGTFAHLFEPKAHAKVAKRLKSFQTRLGRLQDIHIQIRHVTDDMKAGDEAAKLLLAILDNERKKSLKKVFKTIDRFNDKTFEQRLNALL